MFGPQGEVTPRVANQRNIKCKATVGKISDDGNVRMVFDGNDFPTAGILIAKCDLRNFKKLSNVDLPPTLGLPVAMTRNMSIVKNVLNKICDDLF